jgi:hypothetical protein
VRFGELLKGVDWALGEEAEMRFRLSACFLLAASVAVSLPGCKEQAPTRSVVDADLERGREALAPFKEQLVDALMAALEEGGPQNAIHVCRDRAPAIAAELSVDGVEMGRTSHRTRNPDNAPQAWMEPLLTSYLENPENTAPRAVFIDDATIGYVEPIYVMSFCLSCHGPSVEPELLAEIRSVYPQDQAVGFKANDLRGLFWVTLPVTSGG